MSVTVVRLAIVYDPDPDLDLRIYTRISTTTRRAWRLLHERVVVAGEDNDNARSTLGSFSWKTRAGCCALRTRERSGKAKSKKKKKEPRIRAIARKIFLDDALRDNFVSRRSR